jgi:Carboxypeptidase regulatory-like domain
MNKKTRRVLCGCAIGALMPLAVAAQLVGGPKPIPRPDGPYSIGGKIVNGMTGTPVPGAEIAISTGPQGMGPVFEIAESATDGSFRFGRLPEGKYTLKAERRGFAPQAYLQHENYWSGIAVGPGKDSQHLRFPLYPSAVISGQVTDENGEGVRDATVKLWKRALDSGKLSVEMQAQIETDDRGAYRFDHLSMGKYAVSVRATPWYSAFGVNRRPSRRFVVNSEGAFEDGQFESPDPSLPPAQQTGLPDVVYPLIYYPRGNDLSAATWFELRPGQEESADFELTPVPGLHLVVRYEEARTGVPMLSVLEGDSDDGPEAPPASVNIVAPGVAEFSGLAPGRYRINAGGGDAERRSEDVDLGRDSEFDLRQNPTPESQWTAAVQFSGDLAGNPWGALVLRDEAGRTFDASLPLGTITVEQENQEGKAEVLSAETDHPLSFHPAPPAKGVYDVGLTLPVGGTIESLEAIGATVSGNKIAAAGGDVHLKIKGFISQISLQGTAKRNGQPFAGAMMLLLPEKGGPQLVRRDQSDSDGTFTLPNVVPGKYKLFALEHGWEMPWADPEQQKALLDNGLAIEIGKETPRPVTVEVQ